VDRELERIQERFYAMVARGDSLAEARGLVVGDPRLRAETRMAVYRRMYVDRLVEALTDDFPKLAHVIGAAFEPLLREYVRACPPNSPTLRDVGARLPGFLAGRPASPAWHAELAALEWARVDVFDAADAATLAAPSLDAMTPEQFPGLWLRLVPASSVLSFGHPVDDVWSAIEDGVEVAKPSRRSRTVLVWRRAEQVLHRALEEDEASLAPALQVGTTFEAICEELASHADPPARAIELLLRWSASEILRQPAAL